MHSLFFRIFLLFWLAMALIVAASIATTYEMAAREYEPIEYQPRPPAALQASEVLQRGGPAALRGWLLGHQTWGERELWVIGPDGADLLGRRVPEHAWRRRPMRGAAQIVAPDGEVYTVLLTPRRPSIFGALSLPAISLAILGIALLVSALASGWLAQHLSAPIRSLQSGARALASQNLTVRVSTGLEARRDELAVLARDFDAMADQLRANRQATTQLLRDISHELRSPLARMRLALGLARQPPADIARQLDRLEIEIERLDSMIGQILKLARLQGSRGSLAQERFELGELIDEVVRDANFEGAVKHCDVSVQADAQLPAVVGDRELLRSAIENVLRNAVRYSPESAAVQVTVDVSAEGVMIKVQDHGPGVPEADLERIFEPFYRTAAARERDNAGQGVGLAITSQVMKAHGGSASAGNIEAGFEVRLSLPRHALAV